jgi:hypothetical protein
MYVIFCRDNWKRSGHLVTFRTFGICQQYHLVVAVVRRRRRRGGEQVEDERGPAREWAGPLPTARPVVVLLPECSAAAVFGGKLGGHRSDQIPPELRAQLRRQPAPGGAVPRVVGQGVHRQPVRRQPDGAAPVGASICNNYLFFHFFSIFKYYFFNFNYFFYFKMYNFFLIICCFQLFIHKIFFIYREFIFYIVIY